MTKYEHMTDTATLTELGERIARHRLDLNLTQAKLASEAGVSKRTVVRLENGESTQVTNLVRVLRVLGLLANLESLVPAETPSPVEQLRSESRTRKRRRASPNVDDSKQPDREDWAWADEGNE